jgi:single-stranded-DNA-specific exonuclease
VDWLSKWNQSKNLIITLDHHDTRDLGDPNVHNLNPELDGFSGETDASASTIAYLFANSVDSSAVNLSTLAIIGSTEIPGELRGLNKIPLDEGEKAGRVRQVGRSLKLDISGTQLSPSRASTILNVLGSVGYYRQGPETGVKACIAGFDKETLVKADQFETERKKANQKMLSRIREDGLGQLKNVQWFHARDNYKGMSGKVLGSFCSYLSYQRLVNPAKYLIGMMNVPPDIPGWGRLSSALIKVSGRVPQPLARAIETGQRPPLSKILPEACEKLGGFGDGHTVAASGVLPVGVGAEEMFVNEMDRSASTLAADNR